MATVYLLHLDRKLAHEASPIPTPGLRLYRGIECCQARAVLFFANARAELTHPAFLLPVRRTESAPFFSSHPESPRVEFAMHASLFRGCRQLPVNRGKELTCKAISSSAARTTA
jgi:hypothetical protein